MRRMAATPPEHHFLERWQSGRQNRRERFWTAKLARSAQARRASLRMRRAYAPDGRHAAGASFFGEVAEWSNAPDSKSGLRFRRNVGSNPTLSARWFSKHLKVGVEPT